MLNTIKRMINEFNQAGSFAAGLEVIVRRLAEEMKVDVCSVYLRQPHSDTHVLMATYGLNAKAVGKACLAEREGLVSLIAKRAEPINLSNAFEHPNFRFIPGTGEEKFRAFLGVPLIRFRQPIGVLVVQAAESRQFQEDEVTFLMTAATHLAEVTSSNEVNTFIRSVRQGAKSKTLSLKGVSGSPGVAIGTAMVAYTPTQLESIPDRKITDIDAELTIFEHAMEKTTSELQSLSDRMKDVLPEEERLVFDVYIGMIESGSLIDDTLARIKLGNWAPAALRDTVADHVRAFENMEDPYFRERASDIRDIGRRLLMHLLQEDLDTRKIPRETILIGDEISPAQLAEIPSENLIALVSIRGSATSHVAILARAMGIPAVLGVSDLPLGSVEERKVIVDGYAGRVYIDPGRPILKEFTRLLKEEEELADTLLEFRDLPAISPDGVEMTLLASTGLISDVNHALESHCQGIGLHRTEFPFMTRDRFPGEGEQTSVYRKILEPFAPGKVVLRTLDIGGDKDLPYFPIKDKNPFLGWRGIRITLDHPEIFATQLRAMLRADIGLGNLHILFPMISSIKELDESLKLLDRVRRELQEEGYAVEMPKVGAMIEVPAAVYLAEAIARRVDFLSVGTNDLTQYLVAVDRNNPQVAALYDELHPAVLRALLQVAEAGVRSGKPVGVCGSMAGDPAAAILLFAMGFDHLSMSVSSLLRVKWLIRTLTLARAEELLGKALILESAEEIRSLMTNTLEEIGLGSLYRAGK
jgi:phosphotransferase system enzyme I (PtsP)